MASYLNGKRISGIRDFPAYTWAEYHALPVAKRPKVWKCTDRDYTDVLTADDIQYNGGTVKDELDNLNSGLSTHTVLTNSASNVTLNTTTLGIAPVTVTKGLWILEGRVQGINAITSNSARNEIFFSTTVGTRYGLGQATLPHNSPYPVTTITSLVYFSQSTTIGIGAYFDTATQCHQVAMKATKIMDY